MASITYLEESEILYPAKDTYAHLHFINNIRFSYFTI